MLRSAKFILLSFILISQAMMSAFASGPEEVIKRHKAVLEIIYSKSPSEMEQLGYANYIPNVTYTISLDDYFKGARLAPRSDEIYWKSYIAMEALQIIPAEADDDIKILNTEHIKALLSIPAVANDWYLIIQHPAFTHLNATRKQRLLKTLTAVLDQMTANDKEKVNTLKLLLESTP